MLNIIEHRKVPRDILELTFSHPKVYWFWYKTLTLINRQEDTFSVLFYLFIPVQSKQTFPYYCVAGMTVNIRCLVPSFWRSGIIPRIFVNFSYNQHSCGGASISALHGITCGMVHSPRSNWAIYPGVKISSAYSMTTEIWSLSPWWLQMEGPIVRAGVIVRGQFNRSCNPIILQLLMYCLYAQYFQYCVPGRVELGGGYPL